DGQTVLSDVDIVAKDDSTGLNILSDSFDLTAGAHTLTLVGSEFNVDYIQFIQEIASSVSKRNELPQGFALEQNYPNPFNPTTNINFSLGKVTNVELTVFNVLGQKVATLVNQRMPAGTYDVTWDASNVTSGLYFYIMKAGNFTVTRKMMVIK
ncbi:MAG: T9SS type A sorting domain-containing protein, partial [Calditrichaeota bacterium]|nr:T9SS type A sorting domain-containing protein [Calditrichota bacterium]